MSHRKAPRAAHPTRGVDYRICFLNRISRGAANFTVCQRSIVIRGARSQDEAISAAKKRFTELEGIADWRLRASAIETELIEVNAQSGEEAAQ